MSDKVKKVMYWISILPPIYNAIKSVITCIYHSYMNTLMEIEQKKMEEEFNDTWKEK